MVSDNGNLVMPVSPMGNGGGFGGFGGDSWAWIIILLLCGWGGFGGGGFGGGYGNMMLGYDFPWLLNGQNGINANTNAGFQNAGLNSAIAGLQSSVTSGFGDVQTALCSGFGGVNANISNGFAQAEIGANARAMADMQQMFSLQSALQNCCCENRASIADVKYTIANEGCATRQTSTANTQAILDKLCQLELDGVKAQVEAKNDRIAELQSQLNMATLRESQTAQNAFISQGFANEVDQLYNRLSNCPVPSTPVYGRTPIFTCNNGGCGCGM